MVCYSWGSVASLLTVLFLFPFTLFAQPDAFVPEVITIRTDVDTPKELHYIAATDDIMVSAERGVFRVNDLVEGASSEITIDVEELWGPYALLSEFGIDESSGLCAFRTDDTSGSELRYVYDEGAPLSGTATATTYDFLTWTHAADDMYVYTVGVNSEGLRYRRQHAPTGIIVGEINIGSYWTPPVPAWKLVSHAGVSYFIGVETTTNILRVLKISPSASTRGGSPFLVEESTYPANGIVSLNQVKFNADFNTLLILGHTADSVAYAYNIDTSTSTLRYLLSDNEPLTRIASCGSGLVKYRPHTDTVVHLFHYDHTGNVPFSMAFLYSEAEMVRDLVVAPTNKFYMLSHINNLVSGDVNSDGSLDLADAQYLLNYLFVLGPAPLTYAMADVNGDARVDIADAVYLLEYLFVGGPAPIATSSSAQEASIVRRLDFPYDLLCTF